MSPLAFGPRGSRSIMQFRKLELSYLRYSFSFFGMGVQQLP
ncbi:hypothetical protein HMPREF1316_0446 [Olsenella profusa F0195]|uniref:Uncharacterized protein n=1 Tax=Olsenella profusa F0195 TaxID=1125712 RepID=U2V065_9ACTN|nr:hypothetical protein HMPREF1316_0446 [Olsenella profusa F0195]